MLGREDDDLECGSSHDGVRAVDATAYGCLGAAARINLPLRTASSLEMLFK